MLLGETFFQNLKSLILAEDQFYSIKDFKRSFSLIELAFLCPRLINTPFPPNDTYALFTPKDYSPLVELCQIFKSKNDKIDISKPVKYREWACKYGNISLINQCKTKTFKLNAEMLRHFPRNAKDFTLKFHGKEFKTNKILAMALIRNIEFCESNSYEISAPPTLENFKLFRDIIHLLKGIPIKPNPTRIQNLQILSINLFVRRLNNRIIHNELNVKMFNPFITIVVLDLNVFTIDAGCFQYCSSL
jgi:hypothetical protein